MNANDLGATLERRQLVEDARMRGHEGAEAVYRSVPALRDQLPADVQMQVAIALEWARDGIDRRIAQNNTPELVELHAAYAYARDILIASATNGSS